MSKNMVTTFIAMLFFVGCTINTKTRVKHGSTRIQIDCSWLGSSWDRCYQRAKRECKVQGYMVITKSSDVVDGEGAVHLAGIQRGI